MSEYKTLEIRIVEHLKIDEKNYGALYLWTAERRLLGCPRCGVVMSLAHMVTVENNLPTISPSVGCPFCRAHFFVRSGKIEVLSDW
jgi:hypothetical protein